MTETNESNKQANSEQVAQIILSLQIRNYGAMNFNAQVPMKDALKLLQNVTLELMFQELGPKPQGRIVIPNLVHGKPSPDA